MRRVVIAFLIASPVLVAAQAPAPPRPSQAATPASPRQAENVAAPVVLPVRRVILYKTGVGYFEHLGSVRNRQAVTIRFTSAQLDDVLSSLTAIDLGKGQITGISYNSVAPLEQRLGALRLPLDERTTALQVLGSLRGARIEVTAGGVPVEGRLLSVERHTRQRGPETVAVEMLSLVTDLGVLRTFELSPALHVRVVERDLRQEIGRYLDLVGSAREQDVRSMVISTSGAGDRPLFVSYISEVPIWKSTYRLVLPAKGKPLLQGWAIVDNTIGEDWQDVELSLVAGAPQSFIQNISQPYYGRRPVVPMPTTVLLAPQTHQATLGEGSGRVTGTVRDTSGAVLPGVTVRLLGPSGVVASDVTDSAGRYDITAAAGTYQLRAELTGFRPQVLSDWRVPAGLQAQQDIALQVASLQEQVRVDAFSAPSAAPSARLGRGSGGGFAGGVILPEAPAPPPPMPRDVYEQARNLDPRAAASSLGDLFEYRIREPITLKKNQSALVPIVNAEIEAEKVSLWNQAPGSGRPLRALWLKNTTALTLDGGSMIVVDGSAFAGEGLIESLKAGERRFLSYAADLGVLVDARMQGEAGRIFRLRARDGIIIQETEQRTTWTYKARNENATATTLVVEHRIRPGWKLAPGQTPVESTAGAERFRLAIEPGKEAALDVREIRQDETRILIGNVDDELIARLAQSGVSAAALEKALKPVLDKKSEVAALDRRLAQLQSDRGTIVDDQQRLRENMKALRGSAEEKELLRRYTRQLDEQETRLESLQQEIVRTTAARDKARAELSALIQTVSFELERYDAHVEAIAMRVARAFEEAAGAMVRDVSTAPKARAVGLSDYPGFDLLAVYPSGHRRAVEVKGRAQTGDVEVSDNEWARACNLRGEYWLHVVFDCATAHPRLVRVQDPFAKLLVKSAGVIVSTRDILAVGETGWGSTSAASPFPEFLRPLFWDRRIEDLRWPAHRDLVIGRVLQGGGTDAIAWVRSAVPDVDLAAWIRSRDGHGLDARQLRFWQVVLKLPDADVDAWVARFRSSPWGMRHNGSGAPDDTR